MHLVNTGLDSEPAFLIVIINLKSPYIDETTSSMPYPGNLKRVMASFQRPTKVQPGILIILDGTKREGTLLDLSLSLVLSRIRQDEASSPFSWDPKLRTPLINTASR